MSKARHSPSTATSKRSLLEKNRRVEDDLRREMRTHTPARTFEVVWRRKWTLLGLSVAAVPLLTGAASTEESASQRIAPRGRMGGTQIVCCGLFFVSVRFQAAGWLSICVVRRRIGRPSMFLRPKRPSLPIVVPPAVTRSRRHTVCRGISIVRSHVFRSNACNERLPLSIIVEECGDENVVTMSV